MGGNRAIYIKRNVYDAHDNSKIVNLRLWVYSHKCKIHLEANHVAVATGFNFLVVVLGHTR